MNAEISIAEGSGRIRTIVGGFPAASCTPVRDYQCVQTSTAWDCVPFSLAKSLIRAEAGFSSAPVSVANRKPKLSYIAAMIDSSTIPTCAHNFGGRPCVWAGRSSQCSSRIRSAAAKNRTRAARRNFVVGARFFMRRRAGSLTSRSRPQPQTNVQSAKSELRRNEGQKSASPQEDPLWFGRKARTSQESPQENR